MLNLGVGPPAVALRQRVSVALPWLASIDAGGWSGQAAALLTLPAMTSDGTSEFGADGASPKTVAVLRQGFDATGAATSFTESVTITKRVRQAFPNQASATAGTVALSDYVFAADAIAGCANGSTEVSPKPVAAWSRPDRHVVTASDTASVVAFHRCGATLGNLGIACVVFSWSDGANTVTATVTAPTVGGHPGDLNPVIEFVASNVDISSLSDGPVTRNARVYPRIGTAASVADSASGTAGTRAFAPQTLLKSSAAPRYAYVSVGGNDGTAVSSTNAASAAAAPFASLKGALDKLKTDVTGATGIGVVRVGPGSFNLASLAAGTYASAGEIVIERDAATATRSTAVVTWGANASGQHNLAGVSWVRFRDLTLQRSGATTLRVVSGGNIVFENVNIDSNGVTGVAFAGITAATPANVWVLGAAVSNAGSGALFRPTATGANMMLTRGIDMGALGAAAPGLEVWATLGCVLRGGNAISGNAKSESGSVVAFNKFLGITGTLLEAGASADVNGYAFVQNVVEFASATATYALRPSGDARTGNVTHWISWHNSFAGFNTAGRENNLYDETPSTYRAHRLISFAGNVHVQINTKHDAFLGTTGGNPEGFTGASPSLHVGGWPYLYGVGCRAEFSRYIDASGGGLGSSFAQAWPGLGAKIGTGASGAGQDPLFASYAGTTSAGAAGAGGGDYAIASGSPAKAMLSVSPMPIDLAGVTRFGAASAGAFQ